MFETFEIFAIFFVHFSVISAALRNSRVGNVMAEGSIDFQDLNFTTWDWLAIDIHLDGFHLDPRDLLDTKDLSPHGGGEDHALAQHKLRTFDVTNNIDMHDALDASYHQHLDEAMDDRYSRRKRSTGPEEEDEKKSKPYAPWSSKYSYTILFVCNIIMMIIYYMSNFLDGIPKIVWAIILTIHCSAIGLYALDSLTYILQENGFCIPKRI